MSGAGHVVVTGRALVAAPDGSLRPTAPLSIECAGGLIRRITPRQRPTNGGDSLRRESPLFPGDPDAVLLPGLSDSHLHLLAAAADRASLSLADDRPRSIGALGERLERAAATSPPGEWVRASGYDEAWLIDGRHPELEELDRVVPDHLLRVRHATRHGSLVNSRALAFLERRVGRVGARQGAFVHGLEPELTRLVGPVAEGALARALGVISAELLACGVVTIEDLTASNDALRIARLAAAVEDGSVVQRVRAWVRDAGEIGPARKAARGRVEIAGVKLLGRSSEEVASGEFRDAARRARESGLPLAVHAVEPDVIAAALDLLAAAPPRRAAPAQPGAAVPDRIEHAALCPPELGARIARAGVAVVTQPAFLVERGEKYVSQVEEPLWPWLYPLRSLRAAGVLVVASSDAPVVRPDARLGIVAALTRRTAGGTVLGPGECLSESGALELFTSAPARLRGEQGRAGVLAEGARADVVIARNDPTRSGWGSLQARAVVIAGRVHECAGTR
ncbi:MAG TPA: amidohydrolase family protein [Candidatus Bathyarchaeia archaeon]|nr:amidohydrolase family protein [Candidatus Bathyarchaeia archaeon]